MWRTGGKCAFTTFSTDAIGDIWTTTLVGSLSEESAIYLDPRWTATKDPHADYAIARVSSEAGGSIESHVGLALTLGTAPPARGGGLTAGRPATHPISGGTG